MKKNVILSLAIGALALVAYLVSMVDYAFPGVAARLMVLWGGLDSASYSPFPLMRFFYDTLGLSGCIAPVCGAISVFGVSLLCGQWVRSHLHEKWSPATRKIAVTIASAVSALVFLFTPAVHEASSHLEPRMFDAAWAIMTALLVFPYLKASKAIAWIFPALMGVMCGFGIVESVQFLMLAVLYIFMVWGASRRRGGPGYTAAVGFLITMIIASAICLPSMAGDFSAYVDAQKEVVSSMFELKNSLLIPVFAILPFFASLLTTGKSLNAGSSLLQWIFHILLALISILTIASPLAPSNVMRPYGILPVLSSAACACTLAYALVYWFMQTRGGLSGNKDKDAGGGNASVYLGWTMFSVAGVIAIVSVAINAFLYFNPGRGDFADKIADRIVADLGERQWFVTDGALDDHILLAAKRAGKTVHLVCLQRDLDKEYIKELGDLIKKENIAGDKTDSVALSLTLGVWPFIQDWFAADKDIEKKVAIFGAPDLWLYAGKRPIPELFFFGADPSRMVSLDEWKKFDGILKAPEGWGSYRLWDVEDPSERMRLNLRRHLGLIYNNLGYAYLENKDLQSAWQAFDDVLVKIDTDNVSALFNEMEMANANFKPAVAKMKDLKERLNSIIEDTTRRYRLEGLGLRYGYVRNADLFIRLGYKWARSGHPGEGLNLIRRAIDFIPTDNRQTVMNMMAAIYAGERDFAKSRETYDSVLASDSGNYVALTGLARIELMEGNVEKAKEYLKRAIASGGDHPEVHIEVALLHLIGEELDKAKSALRKAIDIAHDNMQAWSLLAITTMRQIDAEKDAAKKVKLEKELAEYIVPTMEKQARGPGDYYVQTTRAFLLMRSNDQEKRRAARDALVSAAKARPDSSNTGDLILGLDIQLNDTKDAEREARNILRRNRKAPLANYVMGSLALQSERIAEAEAFLRRSVDNPNPPPLALNDLAEVLRRTKRYPEAERYARKAVEVAPKLYVAWETLGSILLDAGKDLDEAEKFVNKAIGLSRTESGKESDVRMLITLARVQFARGEKLRLKTTLRKVQARIDELSVYERKEFEEFQKRAK